MPPLRREALPLEFCIEVNPSPLPETDGVTKEKANKKRKEKKQGKEFIRIN